MNEFFEDIKFHFIYRLQYFEFVKLKEEHLFYTKGRGCNAKAFTIHLDLQY